MAKKKCEILVINAIAPVGLKRLPSERYAVVKESKDPWAILVRSQDLHKFEFGPSLRAVGRAIKSCEQSQRRSEPDDSYLGYAVNFVRLTREPHMDVIDRLNGSLTIHWCLKQKRAGPSHKPHPLATCPHPT